MGSTQTDIEKQNHRYALQIVSNMSVTSNHFEIDYLRQRRVAIRNMRVAGGQRGNHAAERRQRRVDVARLVEPRAGHCGAIFATNNEQHNAHHTPNGTTEKTYM